MKLSGTTPLRDWAMSARGLDGSAKMTVTSDQQLIQIGSLDFSIPVHNLQGESAGMDNDCYKALKADRYPEIVFQLTSATLDPQGSHRCVITALGNLTVAGVTRAIQMSMYALIVPDGSITVIGSELLRMSDYNIERPSLLFGAIKAGDEMTLTYTLIFTK
jgi:polyisoprenoid-binding protein YceI